MRQCLCESCHVFAFFYEGTSKYVLSSGSDGILALDDAGIFHRVVHVVRLQPGACFVIFDHGNNVLCRLRAVGRSHLEVHVEACECNQVYAPSITFLIPLLKREAFDDALYSLTELGVTTIVPVITAKSRRTWSKQGDNARALRTIHAAAEQSKNFSGAYFKEPVEFQAYIRTIDAQATKVFFDPQGCLMGNLVTSIKTARSSELVLTVGPEGDLTGDEKRLLDACGFVFCALTPTVLRSEQAAALSVGLLRSYLRS